MNNELEQALNDVAVSDLPIKKPGTLLREKRESLNLTQKQVAEKLRLRVTLIQSLEDSTFNIDKVKTFTRGYVRSYARVVGIEERVILASYDAYCGVEPQELDMKSFSKRTKRDAHNSRINYITFGVIAIVIGISSVWWYQNQSKDSLITTTSISALLSDQAMASSQNNVIVNELPNGVSSLENVEPSLIIEPKTVLDLNDAEMEGPELIDQSSAPAIETTDAAVVVTPATVTQASVKTSQPDATVPTITMKFSDECWIQVKDSTGKTLAIGIKKPGQEVSLDGQAPFNVILGAPESVSMTFASEPVDLSRYTSGKVARFTLPR
jgi:cytoskeleton protein RodZ